MPGVDDVTEHGSEDGELRVYIAGPYTNGNWGKNQRNAINAAQAVLDSGHIPFLPHTKTGLWSVIHDNEWIKFDLKWLEVCDCLIRLDGYSEGADTEVEFAEEHGITVYDGVDDFLYNEVVIDD